MTDDTTHRTAPAPAPILSEETIHHLLMGQKDLYAQNAAIHDEIGKLSGTVNRMSIDLAASSEKQTELTASQELDDKARDRAGTIWKFVKILGVVSAAVVVPAIGALGSYGWGLYSETADHVSELDVEVVELSTELDGHEEAFGHEPIRASVDQNGRAISGMEADIASVRTSQADIARSQRTLESQQGDILRELRRQR